MSKDKAKDTKGKLRLTLVPGQIIKDIAEVRHYAVDKKYVDGGVDNWKDVPTQEWIDAMYRHLLAFVEQPFSKDEESGIEHYKHIACNMAFICDNMAKMQVLPQDSQDLHTL